MEFGKLREVERREVFFILIFVTSLILCHFGKIRNGRSRKKNEENLTTGMHLPLIKWEEDENPNQFSIAVPWVTFEKSDTGRETRGAFLTTLHDMLRVCRNKSHVSLFFPFLSPSFSPLLVKAIMIFFGERFLRGKHSLGRKKRKTWNRVSLFKFRQQIGMNIWCHLCVPEWMVEWF